MGCPDENQLAAFVDGTSRQREVLARHLGQCVTCRRVVSALAQLGVDDAAADEATAMQLRPSQLRSPSAKEPTVSLSPEISAYLEAGTMVGEYMVTGPLGAGGMGAVYAAVHPRIGKRVAIKVLKRDVKQSPTALVRFENEARVVNSICHPNLVDIFAFGELPDGSPYLVMEHVDGESLDKWMFRSGPISLAQAMPILRPIFDALSAAHASGVIHRDLKPGNIMINSGTQAPRIKVLDFGLAKVATKPYDADLELTVPGSIMGTPLFMSPEQHFGADVDHRSDVYALGVLVYLMLCGAYPYLGDSPSQVQLEQLQNPLRLPSTFGFELPPTLDIVLAKALAQSVTERYQSVADFRAALERCIAPTTVVIAPRKTNASPVAVAPPGFIASDPQASTMLAEPKAVSAPRLPVPSDPKTAFDPVTLQSRSSRGRIWVVAGVAAATLAGVWLWLGRASDEPTPEPRSTAGSTPTTTPPAPERPRDPPARPTAVVVAQPPDLKPDPPPTAPDAPATPGRKPPRVQKPTPTPPKAGSAAPQPGTGSATVDPFDRYKVKPST